MKRIPAGLLLASMILMSSHPALADVVRTDPADQPKEMGSVSWYRNLDEGLAAAKAQGRPLFLQFQEVPG